MNLISFLSRFAFAILALLVLANTNQGRASIYTEVGDSGTTFDRIQYIPIDTRTILGNLGEDDGADVYSIDWGGGMFSANTDGSDFDTMLSVFDHLGSLFAFNDDSVDTFSSLSVFLDPGNYFIGITHYPNNYMGDMRYYSNIGIDGFYRISLSKNELMHEASAQQTETAEVPEPSSLALLAIGLIATLTIRINRRNIFPASCLS